MKIYVEKTNELSIPVLPSSRQATVMSSSVANSAKLRKKTLLAQLGELEIQRINSTFPNNLRPILHIQTTALKKIWVKT